MDKLVFSCFILGGLTPDPSPTDSCALNAYCAAGATNVGCNPPPITGGTDCAGQNPTVIDLLAAEQNAILSFLNQRRNAFASAGYVEDGGSMGYGDYSISYPADKMFKLQWDANLATQAGYNARSCTVARDACRNTADFRNVGQLIATYSGQATSLEPAAVTTKINNILDDISFWSYSLGDASFSSYAASTYTENQANILNDRSKKVGCALMQWNYDGTLTLYLVCNFSDNVVEGQPLFTTASNTGCATKDTTYPALCLT